MGKWDGIVPDYVPQCAVCKQCRGLGCKAFETEKREKKYYSNREKDFSKCPEFTMNEDSPQAELFLKLSKKYDWKK